VRGRSWTIDAAHPSPCEQPGKKLRRRRQERSRVAERYVRWSACLLPLAKFISTKNGHFRGYVIQADDGSNRIFLSSVYTQPTHTCGTHTCARATRGIRNCDGIAMRIFDGSSLFTWTRSPWKIYTSCNIHVLNREERSRGRAHGDNLPSREEIILYT